MTRKDYKLIALILAGLCPKCKPAALKFTIELLQQDNPSFDPAKFTNAVEGH